MCGIHIKWYLGMVLILTSGRCIAQETDSCDIGKAVSAAASATKEQEKNTKADIAEELQRKQEARERERLKWRGVRKEYRRTSVSTREAIRMMAVNLLEGIDYIRAAECLVERIMQDRSQPVAERAMDLLAELKSDEVVEYVIKCLGKKARKMDLGDPRLLRLAESLARMDNPMVLPTLIRFVKHKDKRYQILGLEGLASISHPDPRLLDIIRPFLQPGQDFALQISAVRALANIPAEAAVKLLIEMARFGGRIQEEAVKGLMYLTGARAGVSPEEWDKWLQNATNGGQDPLRVKAKISQPSLDNMDFSAADSYNLAFRSTPSAWSLSLTAAAAWLDGLCRESRMNFAN